MSVDDFAVKTATDWRNGLASWEEGPDRIKALKAAADFAIYTPGSEAGLPVSILASFKAPSLDWDTETEILRDRIQGTVSALLGLVGIEADPVRSREHILLSSILEHAWRAGQDLDIAKLIMAVQKPPFRQVGVFEVDTFFPEKERFGLAMTLNNIIASPSFSAWMSGEPLDIGAMLHTPCRQTPPQHLLHRPPQRRRAYVLRDHPAGADHQLDARRSPAPPACAPCSTWMRSSATSRRPPTRRASDRC